MPERPASSKREGELSDRMGLEAYRSGQRTGAGNKTTITYSCHPRRCEALRKEAGRWKERFGDGVDGVGTGEKHRAQSLMSHAQTRGQALRRFENRTALASLSRRAGGYLKGGVARRRIRLEGD